MSEKTMIPEKITERGKRFLYMTFSWRDFRLSIYDYAAMVGN